MNEPIIKKYEFIENFLGYLKGELGKELSDELPERDMIRQARDVIVRKTTHISNAMIESINNSLDKRK